MASFQTFTGSSRRRRQVDLSGRPPQISASHFRPMGFGAPQNSPQVKNMTGLGTPENVIQNAQQSRLARQQERERAQAATKIQKSWRGYSQKERFKDMQRHRWDDNEGNDTQESSAPYDTEEEDWMQMSLLLKFVRFDRKDDVQRLRRLLARHLETERMAQTDYFEDPWPSTYRRLQSACLVSLDRAIKGQDVSLISGILSYLNTRSLEPTQQDLNRYYKVISRSVRKQTLDLDLIVKPLQTITSSTVAAYVAFATQFLTLPELHNILGGPEKLEAVAAAINCKLLAKAVSTMLTNDRPTIPLQSTVNPHDLRRATNTSSALEKAPARTWLLSYLIYFYHHAHSFANSNSSSTNEDFISAVSILMSSIVDHIELDADVTSVKTYSNKDRYGQKQRGKLVHPFVREQLDSLVNQESISGLLSQIQKHPMLAQGGSPQNEGATDYSRVLANYVLTLLRLFPKRGEDIRMWLYLGSNSSRDNGRSGQPDVISFFWQAASNTLIFKKISDDPRAAIDLLKPVSRSFKNDSLSYNSGLTNLDSTDDQWRSMLIFIELYLFVLRIMDDDEFFTDTNNGSAKLRKNSLGLLEIEHLVTFLKNLGFTMYYHASAILDTPADDIQQKNYASIFLNPTKANQSDEQKKPTASHIAGLESVTLDYVKGIVTGLLRAIYERDSRRPFLPSGHWLMTDRFEMSRFIGGVVQEEERRNQVEDEENSESSESSSEENESAGPISGITGMSHAQAVMRTGHLERRRRKALKRRYLQAVAPRLEILQNMPFLIPFPTRVEIFRRFVFIDQLKRRNGNVDPELWRMNMSNTNNIERHHAHIRRGHEFEDAYEQFYPLGQTFKEPINITFIDRFGSEEAGIDGGGVTKEFLTSVTNQVFTQSDGLRMFAETDKHLLYPNPAVIDEQKEIIRESGLPLDSPEAKAQISDLLYRYDFLGKIIGKCLYEGILVDIHFASFFLLKWALTGGTGLAPKESGYRAGLNDLRDFDESLYQGLLHLKNYPGNVEEDFSLDFTVTDTIALPTDPPSVKTVIRQLTPGGSSKPVTNANRLAYISYVARHRLSNMPFRQTHAFLSGLASLIQPSWLSMFNQSELQTLIGGATMPLDVDDLRKNTVYGGLYVIGDDGLEHPSVALFWRVMKELEDEDRRKVVKFVTSTPRAPLLGFGSLNPKFCIRDSGRDQTRLPSTSTCVNLLKLPTYSNASTLKSKLLQAVNSGAGFDLS